MLFDEYFPADEIVNIAQGGILRAFADCSPFCRRQFSVETVKHTVEDYDLAGIEGCAGMTIPEARFCLEFVWRLT